uniref:Cerebellin 20 n=1 Tax=Seriola dumerili TaxID=41447 RepID=A0A3B4UF83_SERDU
MFYFIIAMLNIILQVQMLLKPFQISEIKFQNVVSLCYYCPCPDFPYTQCHTSNVTRSFFLVAVNLPVTDFLIVYKHVFLNLGDSYNMQTGIFTAPRSGVYSFAVTIFSVVTSGKMATSANLQVNGQAMATLLEQNGNDTEDSATVVVALQLKAGDEVAVNLLKRYSICDNNSHFNTFTGFLLYATD